MGETEIHAVAPYVREEPEKKSWQLPYGSICDIVSPNRNWRVPGTQASSCTGETPLCCSRAREEKRTALRRPPACIAGCNASTVSRYPCSTTTYGIKGVNGEKGAHRTSRCKRSESNAIRLPHKTFETNSTCGSGNNIHYGTFDAPPTLLDGLWSYGYGHT